jgi:hypothetical protein
MAAWTIQASAAYAPSFDVPPSFLVATILTIAPAEFDSDNRRLRRGISRLR